VIKTKIIILGVLHSFHKSVPGFSLEHLESALKKIKPDIIAAELMQSEIDAKKTQTFKIEYSIILPYCQKNKVPVLGLDPEEPAFSQMVDPYIKNQKEFPHRSSSDNKNQEIFHKELFDYLIKEHWTSAGKVQSDVTNALFEVKHRFQDALLGKAEKDGWSGFNTHYVKLINELASKHKGKTILVTIGVEHVYWLKKELSLNENIEVLNTERLIN
jgi:hypothetical protein